MSHSIIGAALFRNLFSRLMAFIHRLHDIVNADDFIKLLIGLSLLVIIVLFIIIAHNNILFNYRTQRDKKLNAYLENLLATYLFDLNQKAEVIKKLTIFCLRGNLYKDLLVKLFNSQSRNFSGELRQDLQNLYRHLNLHDFSKKKLNSMQWEVQVAGLRELTAMDIKEYAGYMTACLTSNNKFLEMEALSALVELIRFDVIDYLSHGKYYAF